MDADEAPGLANAVALGQVVEDRDGGRFGEVATIQWCALTLGEAGPAGVAVELAELLLFAVVAADREVAGVTFAVERTAGILAAETCEVVHEANWPSARGGDVFGTELRQSRLILRTIPRHGSTYLGHNRKTSVHGNDSELGVCKGVKPVGGPLVVSGKDQDSAHDRWTLSEHSAEENPLELQCHRK